jgi:hypothetical protein
VCDWAGVMRKRRVNGRNHRAWPVPWDYRGLAMVVLVGVLRDKARQKRGKDCSELFLRPASLRRVTKQRKHIAEFRGRRVGP